MPQLKILRLKLNKNQKLKQLLMMMEPNGRKSILMMLNGRLSMTIKETTYDIKVLLLYYFVIYHFPISTCKQYQSLFCWNLCSNFNRFIELLILNEYWFHSFWQNPWRYPNPLTLVLLQSLLNNHFLMVLLQWLLVLGYMCRLTSILMNSLTWLSLTWLDPFPFSFLKLMLRQHLSSK